MKRWQCHSCKARVDDQDGLSDPNVVRYTYFTTHLDEGGLNG